MGAPVGEPLDVFAKHNFIIEIDGIARAGFKSATGLEAEVSVITYHEGGRDIPHKSPGKRSFARLVLERGATIDTDLWEWFNETANTSTGRGLKLSELKRNLDIVALDRDGSERRRYSVYAAFPVKFVPGEFDGEAETDPQVETVELEYDYFDITA